MPRDAVPTVTGCGETLAGDLCTTVVEPSKALHRGVADPSGCRRYSASRLLEPRILIRSVVDYQFSDHSQVACMRRIQKRSEIIQCAEVWIDIKIIGNVVAVVTQRRWIEWEKPDCSDPQLLQVIELFHQSAEIAHPVAVAVAKGLNVQFVDYRILVPQRIDSCFASICCHTSNLCCIRRPVQSLGLHN